MSYIRRQVLKVSAAVIAIAGAAACTARPMESSSAAALITAPTAVAETVSAASASAQVCHALGNGSFALLSISANALPAHLRHGDGQPGGQVPGGTAVFSNSCEAIASVTGVWEGEWISHDANANCGRDRNLMRLTLTQTGTDVTGTMYWKILESFYPPDVGMEQTRPISNGTVDGTTFTYTVGPASASATFNATTMTGTVAFGSGCPANTFTLTRQ
ncbi:MAG TPA: hypothetical protein VFZ31_03130 [Vicinamibacterales bacterium]